MKSPITRLRRLSAALLTAGLLLPGLARAAAEPEPERWYEVEMIVFAYPDKGYLEAEVWPEAVAIPETAKAVVLNPAPEQPPQAPDEVERFQRLGPTELTLTEAVERMRLSSRFEPLLHVGWRQPGMPLENAIPVYLHASPAIPTGSDGGESGVESADATPGPAVLTEEPRLEGTVALKLGRYLHLDTDLVYRLPRTDVAEAEIATASSISLDPAAGLSAGADFPPEALAEPPMQAFLMDESRRMRSGELHYLDHPLFGLVARVTPYELPEPPKPAAPAAEPSVAEPARGGRIQR